MSVPAQANPFGVDNRPFWRPGESPRDIGHQEVWYMKVNCAETRRALWLRFTLLLRADGSKQVAETWGIFFERRDDGRVRKAGVKNTYDLERFQWDGGEGGFRIAESFLSDSHTAGEVRNGEHTIRWDFQLKEGSRAAFDFVPVSMRRLGLVKNTAVNVLDDLRFSGWSEVDGERYLWDDAPGMQGHLAGPKNGHSWAWGHCNMFKDETGQPATLLFDGLSARARLGSGRATPLLTTLYVRHNGRDYCLNRLRDALRIRARYSPGSWSFSARQGGTSFEGNVFSELDDFAGVTYEDTDGSALYCYNSKVSSMTLDIKAPDGRAQRFEARGNVAFEFVTRERHPEVPLII